MRTARGLVVTLVALISAVRLDAQGYRLRLDTHLQRAAFRGIEADSIAATDAVVGSTGGPETADGFAVTCGGGDFCRFFRPGARQLSAPLVQQADATAWGFGVAGLSLRANARLLTDVTPGNKWPETEPAVQLLEGYAEYAAAPVTARAGRQIFTSRLGPTGFDGGRVMLRSMPLHLDAEVFGGWGLARASALPITSPVLNPLDEYRPVQRGLLFGGALGWSAARASLRADYARELEGDTHYFMSERAALSGEVRPLQRWSV
ncbi:MAG: hypothetical protein ABI637_01775, partial [Gemmatimonadota bacterium]